MGEHIGYTRVSSVGQCLDRQLDGIELDHIYSDKVSGATKDRPALAACLAYIRKGDTLHVHSLDRLARSLRDLLEIVETATAKGITVHFHTENLTFTTNTDNPYATMQLSLLATFAQFERSISKARQREGIAMARKKGTQLGRPSIDYSLSSKVKEMKQSGMSVNAISLSLGLSRPSIYKLLSAA